MKKNHKSVERYKKICLFLPSLRGGGAERVLSTLASSFASQGYKVDLLLAEGVGPYLQNIPHSVNIVDLQCNRVIFCLPKLVSYLRKEQPYALLSTMSHANVVALWAAKLAGFKGRVVIRQANMMTKVRGRRASLKGIVSSFFLRRGAPSASAVVVLNNSMGEEFVALTGLSPSKLRTISNPVDITAIQKKALDNIDHAWLKSADVPVLISVGRLTKQKNFPFLINAFAEVKKIINAKLLILGDGELRDSLNKQIVGLGLEDSVQLIGFKSNPYAYMSKAALFILPSRWEGFPNALVEAMACSTPVIATSCPGGSKEILDNGKWGEVVPVDDIEALSNAILKTLSQTKYPNVLDRVAEFSLEQISAQYLDVLLNDGKSNA